jgi:hypothetical protein
MQLYDLHAKLYEGMPEGTIINVCELSNDDARLVSANLTEVAQVLGHTGEKMEAAQEGDTWHINADLTSRFQALIAGHGVEE